VEASRGSVESVGVEKWPPGHTRGRPAMNRLQTRSFFAGSTASPPLYNPRSASGERQSRVVSFRRPSAVHFLIRRDRLRGEVLRVGVSSGLSEAFLVARGRKLCRNPSNFDTSSSLGLARVAEALPEFRQNPLLLGPSGKVWFSACRGHTTSSEVNFLPIIVVSSPLFLVLFASCISYLESTKGVLSYIRSPVRGTESSGTQSRRLPVGTLEASNLIRLEVLDIASDEVSGAIVYAGGAAGHTDCCGSHRW
jgi:hypothetical protein